MFPSNIFSLKWTEKGNFGNKNKHKEAFSTSVESLHKKALVKQRMDKRQFDNLICDLMYPNCKKRAKDTYLNKKGDNFVKKIRFLVKSYWWNEQRKGIPGIWRRSWSREWKSWRQFDDSMFDLISFPPSNILLIIFVFFFQELRSSGAP